MVSWLIELNQSKLLIKTKKINIQLHQIMVAYHMVYYLVIKYYHQIYYQYYFIAIILNCVRNLDKNSI